jgi:hypothetical protein
MNMDPGTRQDRQYGIPGVPAAVAGGGRPQVTLYLFSCSYIKMKAPKPWKSLVALGRDR